jgi:hypothetical protein
MLKLVNIRKPRIELGKTSVQLFIKNIAGRQLSYNVNIIGDFCPVFYKNKWPQYLDCAKVA